MQLKIEELGIETQYDGTIEDGIVAALEAIVALARAVEKENTKEVIVGDLLRRGEISAEEAVVLLKRQMPTTNTTGGTPKDVIEYVVQKLKDFPIKQAIFTPEDCSCHPNNGGSGICGCTLFAPKIT